MPCPSSGHCPTRDLRQGRQLSEADHHPPPQNSRLRWPGRGAPSVPRLGSPSEVSRSGRQPARLLRHRCRVIFARSSFPSVRQRVGSSARTSVTRAPARVGSICACGRGRRRTIAHARGQPPHDRPVLAGPHRPSPPSRWTNPRTVAPSLSSVLSPAARHRGQACHGFTGAGTTTGPSPKSCCSGANVRPHRAVRAVHGRLAVVGVTVGVGPQIPLLHRVHPLQ